MLGSWPADLDVLLGCANLLTQVKGQTEEGDRMAKRQEELEKTAKVTGGSVQACAGGAAAATVDYMPVGHPSHFRPWEERGASAAPAGWTDPRKVSAFALPLRRACVWARERHGHNCDAVMIYRGGEFCRV